MDQGGGGLFEHLLNSKAMKDVESFVDLVGNKIKEDLKGASSTEFSNPNTSNPATPEPQLAPNSISPLQPCSSFQTEDMSHRLPSGQIAD